MAKTVTKHYFKRLSKYEDDLNKCIRCGYCYELCPLFKSTSWESDTPRAKLVLVYGLITGQLKPNQEIAEKLFECVYCQNCKDNCSAGVPVTDIFTDARKDLIDAGFKDVQGTVVKIDEDLCSVCGICVSVCKYDALTIKGYKGKEKIEVDKSECKGCGLCVAACPSQAISQVEGFEVSLKELHERVSKMLKSNDELKLLVFCCNWAIFPGLQLSEAPTLIKTPFGVIVSMCSGRITPELILDAFGKGVWGVLIAGCPPEECDHNGNYKARRRLLLLQKYLKDLNIEPERLKIEWFKTGETAKLKKAINSYSEQIKNLGPINKK